MRAITVRQPGAWAIIHGGKGVENRSRNIAGSYRGLVAIHAGLHKFEQDNAASRAHRAAHGGEVGTEIVFGAIIGVVELTDVHDELDTERVVGALCSPWAMRYHHHLILSAPIALPRPIPCKGLPGLWTLPDDLTAQVAGQIGETLGGAE